MAIVSAPIAVANATATTLALPYPVDKIFDLGTPTAMLSVSCPAATTPGGASHYRIWAE